MNKLSTFISTVLSKVFNLFSNLKSKFNIANVSKLSNIGLNLSLMVCLFVITFYFIGSGISNKSNDPDGPGYEYVVYRSMTELHYYSLKEDLVTEIDKYIDSVAPSSALNGITILDECDNYNVNLCFVLAQAQLESHFGTQGIGGDINSPWNVHVFDNKSSDDMRRSKHKYDHPDKAIRPYLELLNNKYLRQGKTEYDLMHNFVNINGDRYASNPKYESMLSSLYVKIVNDTDIMNKYKEYKKYKIILNAK